MPKGKGSNKAHAAPCLHFERCRYVCTLKRREDAIASIINKLGGG